MNIFIKSMIITSSVISALGAMDPERTNPSSFKSSEEILTNAKRKIRNNNLPEAALAYLEAERVFNEFESEKQKNNPLLKEMKAFRNLPGYKSDSQSQDMGYFLKAAENGTLVIPAATIGGKKAVAGSDNEINSKTSESRKLFEMGQKFMSKLNELNYNTAPEGKLAFDCFKKAAVLNHARAQYMVGVFYKDGGGGIRVSKEEAFKYFKMASQNPNELEAYYELGLAYLNGYGTRQNFDLAIKSLEHAVKGKHLLSQIELGVLYLGDFAKLHKDFKKAESLLKEPARKGDVRAMAALARLYELGGHGVHQNYKLAFDNYLKAANKGYAPVYMLLSICYSEGKGVEINPAEATKWLTRAIQSDKNTGEMVTHMMFDKTEDAHIAALQEQLNQLVFNSDKKPDIEKINNLLNVKVPDSIKKKTPIDVKKQQSPISIAPVLPLATPIVTQGKPTQQPVQAKTRRGNQKSIKAEVAAAIKETAPLQPLENPAPVITQETLVYTRMGLKKINVEGVKAIYEKTLVKGEIYEANPNKDKMINHILNHQNSAKPEAQKEIPQIVLSDAERFANDNTAVPDLLDIPSAYGYVPPSVQTAKELFKTNLTKTTDVEAKYEVGLAYFNGSGTPQNLENAKQSFIEVSEAVDASDALKIESKKKLAMIEQMSIEQNGDEGKDKKSRKTLSLMERKPSRRNLKRVDSLSKSERSIASERSSERWSLNSEIQSESGNGSDLSLVIETATSERNLDYPLQMDGRIIEYSTKGLKDIQRLLTPEERVRMENEIGQNPTAKNAPIIQKSGGARKIRFAKDGMGKSYSIRVIYTYNPTKDKIIVIRVYDKSEEKALPIKAKQEIKSFIKKINK